MSLERKVYSFPSPSKNDLQIKLLNEFYLCITYQLLCYELYVL